MININQVFKALNEHPIAYYPIYAKITGSVTAGILLSQLMYWHSRMNGREFYKTDKELMEETCLGLWELKAAKTKLTTLQLCDITRKGVPAKSYYLIHEDKTMQLITDFMDSKPDIYEDINTVDSSIFQQQVVGKPITSCGKNQQLDVGKTNNKTYRKPTTTTETTTETTTNNKYPIPKESQPNKEKREHAKGTFLDPNTQLTEKWRTVAIEHGIHSDWVDLRFSDFLAYWCAGEGKKCMKKDWLATWRNNCSSATSKFMYPRPEGLAMSQPSSSNAAPLATLTFDEGNVEMGGESSGGMKGVRLYRDKEVGGAFFRYDKFGTKWKYDHMIWINTGQSFIIEEVKADLSL
jgi:hypothetical protein